MADVTLVATDLIYPVGELQQAMFPTQGELAANVGQWLDEAASNTAVTALSTSAAANTAARHWVLYRAYSAVAQRIALQPSSESRSDVDRSWGQGRIDYFSELAASHKASFDGAVTVAGAATGMALFTVAKANRLNG